MPVHPRSWGLGAAGAAAVLMLALLPQPTLAQGLAELYRAALTGNPIVKMRGFDVERARAEADGARSRLLPQVSAQANWSTNEYRESSAGDQSYGGKRASVTARQSLYDPASGFRVDAARATVQQREQELAQTRQMLFSELLDRYLQALAAQDLQASLVAEAQAAGRHVDRLQAMRAREMAKVTDLLEGQAYVQSLVTLAIDADNRRAEALARLSELSGVDVVQVSPLVRAAFDPVSRSANEWAADAQRSHPRLLALAQEVDAARRQVQASRAERLPHVAATLSHVYSDQGFDNRQQPPYHATSLGIELRVPLYEGGRVDAAVRESTARQSSAKQQLESARREIERETISQWLSARANHARMGSTNGEVLALEQTVQAQERGLELGVSRITDLLDARRRQLKALADQSKARYDFIRDVVGLQISSGSLTDADIANWTGWFAASGR